MHAAEHVRASFDPALPAFPRELLERVCECVAPLEFMRAWAATCRELSFRWYRDLVYTSTVTVPDDVATINAAINRLAGSSDGVRKGLVLVRPGLHAESVRITQDCHILGCGARRDVVVEAPGWESALVSAGLGGRNVPSMLGWSQLVSGDDARVENLTFRCRNELMVGRCVYIVMGQLSLVSCNIHGGIVVSGSCTAPRLHECRIFQSRGNGVYLTDRSKARLKGNCVLQHGHHGIVIDRHAAPVVAENSIQQNGSGGIKVFCGTLASQADAFMDNDFRGNGGDEVQMVPRVMEAESDSGDEA